MADEAPVRVSNGSVEIRVDSPETGVDWTQAGPWKWVRRGAASDRLGPEWVVVNGTPMPGDRVRVRTTEGELFFSYVGGRTHLDTSVRLTRRDPDRRLLRSETAVIIEAAVPEEEARDEAPEWRLIPIPPEERQAQP